jgi:hypothetical protein
LHEAVEGGSYVVIVGCARFEGFECRID